MKVREAPPNIDGRLGCVHDHCVNPEREHEEHVDDGERHETEIPVEVQIAVCSHDFAQLFPPSQERSDGESLVER